MKKGFTMIELIFVIVILGILAAVAIPRLSATRDDAQIAKALSEISTTLNDFGAYYTARGSFDRAADMTNVRSWAADANVSAGGAITYQTPTTGNGLEDCVTYTFTQDGNIMLSNSAGGGAGNVCLGVRATRAYTDLIANTKSFGGRRAIF